MTLVDGVDWPYKPTREIEMELHAIAQSITGTDIYEKTGTMIEITTWLHGFITIEIAHVAIRPVRDSDR